ncbi:hypothetical protein BJ170DRAFT_687896 [Xylariales sp. AK1849]|nr:hypothetical protein BJ170DRAFT_687896 [Xylariales sp. AK1849]
MQIANILASLALASSAAADCYSGGNSWGSNADSLAKSACDGLLSGTFGPQSTYNGEKATCLNHVAEKYEFHVWHLKEGEATLSAADCYDGIMKEVGCKNGGESSYTNWKYKADPNAGSC